MEHQRVHFRGAALVVALDICSSSTIAESLILAGDFSCFVELITAIKHHLAADQKAITFDPYKFTGDGWILLFSPSVDGEQLVAFLKRLCAFYAREFRRRVLPNLLHVPRVSGLSFGIDKGPIIDMKIYGQWEYISRALTVACRLQNAVGDKCGSPAYKALVTNVVFREQFSGSKDLKVSPASRVLKNINQDAPFRCREVTLLR